MAESLFHVDYDVPGNMELKRPVMRRAFVAIGQTHMRDARRLVMRRATSKPGENPAYKTGKLARSIGYYVPRASSRRSGLMVRIAPNQKRGEGNRLIQGDFYPAFLYYGVKNGAKRQKSHHKGKSGGNGWRVAPRNNFMTEVLERRKAWTRYTLQRALRKALKAPKVKRVKK